MPRNLRGLTGNNKVEAERDFQTKIRATRKSKGKERTQSGQSNGVQRKTIIGRFGGLDEYHVKEA